jgi:Uma2 family endonuclease
MSLKLIEYFQSGTRLAWIVDPKTRTVAVYHHYASPTRIVAEHEMIDGGEVLPGLEFPVVDMFLNVARAQ